MTLPCVYASSGILPGRDGPSGVVVSIVVCVQVLLNTDALRRLKSAATKMRFNTIY